MIAAFSSSLISNSLFISIIICSFNPIVLVSFKINPYLIIVSISLTFINYVMYFTIENPDVKMIEQLNIAKDQADKANRAKTDFLSSMSHEIRTPLNAIVGFSECIKQSKTLDEAQAFIKYDFFNYYTVYKVIQTLDDFGKITDTKLFKV